MRSPVPAHGRVDARRSSQMRIRRRPCSRRLALARRLRSPELRDLEALGQRHFYECHDLRLSDPWRDKESHDRLHANQPRRCPEDDDSVMPRKSVTPTVTNLTRIQLATSPFVTRATKS